MFDITEQFLIELINFIPYLIPLILVFNLLCDMLFGRNG